MTYLSPAEAFRPLKAALAAYVYPLGRHAGLIASSLAAVMVLYATEYTTFGIAMAVLSWGFIKFLWLVLLRRPALSALLSLAIIIVLILLSQFKFGIVWMTATFLDVLIIDADTMEFLTRVVPQLSTMLVLTAVIAVPLVVLIWRSDPIRVPRRASAAGAMLCAVGIVPLSLAVPEQGWEPFQGINHVSNFARSGVYAVSQLMARGWLEAAPWVPDPVAMTSDAPCRPAAKLPNIVVVLDELSFNAASVPGIKLPPGYTDYFRSFDGQQRSLLVEATGGPTWYSEYNLLAGLSARSYGKLMFYVTRIAAGRVERGLPASLKRCGYKTFSLYPTFGDFLSARRFQSAVGIEHFIDQSEMGAESEMLPDRYFYDQTRRLIARERGNAPLFIFTYLTANHFPWTVPYRADLTPDWQAPGNTAEIDEYLRRQTMSAKDRADFLTALERDFPDEPFLILRFGDHQPAISTKMLEPSASPSEIAQRIRTFDPTYFTTYYAIDALNFDPVNVSPALDTLEGSYLPLVILQAAGVPLDPSFAEQKRILERCKGIFYACAGGAEARRFNRLLMDAGLIKGL